MKDLAELNGPSSWVLNTLGLRLMTPVHCCGGTAETLAELSATDWRTLFRSPLEMRVHMTRRPQAPKLTVSPGTRDLVSADKL
jgi:hypothetical protein